MFDKWREVNETDYDIIKLTRAVAIKSGLPREAVRSERPSGEGGFTGTRILLPVQTLTSAVVRGPSYRSPRKLSQRSDNWRPSYGD